MNNGYIPISDESYFRHKMAFDDSMLRDYFAAKAIQGIAVAGALPINDAARIAYEYADAMLEARKR